jgi:hypothetical protein
LRKFIFVVTAVTMLVGLFGAPAYASVLDAPGSDSSVTAPGAVPNGNVPPENPPVVPESKDPSNMVAPPEGVYPQPIQDPAVTPDSDNPGSYINDPDVPNPGPRADDMNSGYDDTYYVYDSNDYDYSYDGGFDLFAFWAEMPWIVPPMLLLAAGMAVAIYSAFTPRMDEEDYEPEDEPKKEIRPQDDPDFDPDAPRELEPHPDYGTPPVRQ